MISLKKHILNSLEIHLHNRQSQTDDQTKQLNSNQIRQRSIYDNYEISTKQTTTIIANDYCNNQYEKKKHSLINQINIFKANDTLLSFVSTILNAGNSLSEKNLFINRLMDLNFVKKLKN